MAMIRPTLKEIIARMDADAAQILNNNNPILTKALIWVFVRVFAGGVHLLYGFIIWASRQIFIQTCDNEKLDTPHGTTWEIPRLMETKATGSCLITGIDTTVIPADTQLQRQDGFLYQTVGEFVIDGDSITAAIIAVNPGISGNCAGNTTLSFVTPISGIDSTTQISYSGCTGGTDREEADAYRARQLARIQAPAMGGDAEDYLQWMSDVNGVYRKWVFPLWQGVGTVGLCFITDDPDDSIPGSSLVTTVQTHIDEEAPITDFPTVYTLAEKTIDITIHLSPNTSIVRDAVTNAIKEFLWNVGEPDGVLFLSQLNEAISLSEGEIDHAIDLPLDDITITSSEFPVLGTITFLDM